MFLRNKSVQPHQYITTATGYSINPYKRALVPFISGGKRCEFNYLAWTWTRLWKKNTTRPNHRNMNNCTKPRYGPIFFLSFLLPPYKCRANPFLRWFCWLKVLTENLGAYWQRSFYQSSQPEVTSQDKCEKKVSVTNIILLINYLIFSHLDIYF